MEKRMSVVKKGERRVAVGNQQVIVCGLERDEDGTTVGHMLKLLPGPPEVHPWEYFSPGGESFHPMSSFIGFELKMNKAYGPAETDPLKLTLMREALKEWQKTEKDRREIHSFDPVAVALNQSTVYAPGHETWTRISCKDCGKPFAIGYNFIHGDRSDEAKAKYVKRFEDILVDEHKRGEEHRDSYELGR
jgi:hypothetical protein